MGLQEGKCRHNFLSITASLNVHSRSECPVPDVAGALQGDASAIDDDLLQQNFVASVSLDLCTLDTAYTLEVDLHVASQRIRDAEIVVDVVASSAVVRHVHGRCSSHTFAGDIKEQLHGYWWFALPPNLGDSKTKDILCGPPTRR